MLHPPLVPSHVMLDSTVDPSLAPNLRTPSPTPSSSFPSSNPSTTDLSGLASNETPTRRSSPETTLVIAPAPAVQGAGVSKRHRRSYSAPLHGGRWDQLIQQVTKDELTVQVPDCSYAIPTGESSLPPVDLVSPLTACVNEFKANTLSSPRIAAAAPAAAPAADAKLLGAAGAEAGLETLQVPVATAPVSARPVRSGRSHRRVHSDEYESWHGRRVTEALTPRSRRNGQKAARGDTLIGYDVGRDDTQVRSLHALPPPAPPRKPLRILPPLPPASPSCPHLSFEAFPSG